MEAATRGKITKKERRRIMDLFGKHISKGQIRFLSAGHLDIFEGERRGATFTEKCSGKRFIDAFSSAGCFNAGRGNSRIIKAVEKAAAQFDMGSAGFMSMPKLEYAKKLVALAPGDLKRLIYAGSGADAIEGAIKLARGATGRSEIISMINAYHGHSGFSLSANGKDYYKELFQPLMPEFRYAPFGDLKAVSEMASEKTAAILLEPIQGEGGIHVGTDSYLAGLRKLCDQLGIVLIFDEIQTGFGRTGRMWASEHSGVVPDIMLLAKSISGGFYPNAAILYRDVEIFNRYIDKNPEFHTTFGGGSDLGCAVGLEVLEFIVSNRLWENAEKMGRIFLDGLNAIREENPKIIKEVRGRGLMVGMEYTREFMGLLMADCLARSGMFAAYSGNAPQVMRFQIPITVTQEEIEEALSIIRKAVRTLNVYLLFLDPLSRIPVAGKLVDRIDILVSISVLLRKFELWR